ncbi:hypothetical protein SAMN04489864_103256 [Pedobacter insulae]|uniref:Uncharacterized protein n=1 Tax=Pedobacter insulae TaxID=414048 RepID=A0A1I2VTB6_9SPHI|nr:hypothetical protein SAMN04489864_103256 [Pedobacter insulae]
MQQLMIRATKLIATIAYKKSALVKGAFFV